MGPRSRHTAVTVSSVDEGTDQRLEVNVFNKDDNVNTTKYQNNKCEKPKQSYLVHRHKDRRQPPTKPNTKQAT